MEQQQQVGKAMVRRSEEEILKHLRDQEQSEFSVSEYCEMFEIVEQTFYSWIKKYRSKPEDGGNEFCANKSDSNIGAMVWSYLQRRCAYCATKP